MSANAPSDYRSNWSAMSGWLFVLITAAMTVPWQLGEFNLSKPLDLRVDLGSLIALDHLIVHGAKFGTEIVFPYGPFVFLLIPIYWPGLFWYFIVGRLLISVAVALGSWHLLRSLGLWNPLNGALAFMGLGFLYLTGTDGMLILAAPLLLYCYALDGPRRLSLATLLLTVAGSLASLTRFSTFLLMGFIVAITLAADIAFRRRPPLLAMTFIGSLIACWLIAGQSLGTIPAWISTSFELGEGFTGAMSVGYLEWKRIFETVAFLLSGAVLVVAQFLALRTRTRSGWENALYLVGFMLCVYVSYKHGIVRHDGHAIWAAVDFVGYSGLLLALLMSPQTRTWRHGIAAVALCFVVALNLQIYSSYRSLPDWQQTAAKIKSNLTIMSNPFAAEAELRARFDSDLKKFSQAAQLPALTGTVDQWPDNGALAVLSGYNYKPRPMFTSFSVYSKTIGQRNAAFLDSAEAPDHMLFEVATIDGRLPTIDDPLSWVALVKNYDVADLLTSGLLVLDRRSSPRQISSSAHLDTEIAWDETLTLNTAPGRLVRMQLDAKLTWIGQLLSLAYKPPEIWLEVKYAHGLADRFRLVPENAKLGFILSPVIVDDYGVLQLFGVTNIAPGDRREVVSVKVVSVPNLGFAYKKRMRVQLSYLDRNPGQGAVPKNASPTMQHVVSLGQLRTVSAGSIAAAVQKVAGLAEPVLYAHAPNSLAIDVGPNAESLTLGLGMLPGVETGLSGDGVIFRVLGKKSPEDKGDLLFERHLDPAHNRDDLGTKTATVPLPQGVYKELILETNPGRDTAYDQSYWTDVRIK
jgi:hypothetical protein